MVKYAVDRTNTTATVFLGMTMGCAECHDHKYDPLSQRDFYSLFAASPVLSRRRLAHGLADFRQTLTVNSGRLRM